MVTWWLLAVSIEKFCANFCLEKSIKNPELFVFHTKNIFWWYEKNSKNKKTTFEGFSSKHVKKPMTFFLKLFVFHTKNIFWWYEKNPKNKNTTFEGFSSKNVKKPMAFSLELSYFTRRESFGDTKETERTKSYLF